MNIVQLGTNNGNDDVKEFCLLKNPEKIILIEPFKIHIDEIKKNYKDIIHKVYIENIAIVSKKNMDKISLYYTDLDGPLTGPECSYQVTSVFPEHLIKHGYNINDLKSFDVECLTLNDLFDKQLGIKEIKIGYYKYYEHIYPAL